MFRMGSRILSEHLFGGVLDKQHSLQSLSHLVTESEVSLSFLAFHHRGQVGDDHAGLGRPGFDDLVQALPCLQQLLS